MTNRFTHFKEFYPFYLGEHRNRTCRRLHFIGSCLVILTILSVLISNWWWGFILVPIFGYGFAWTGHYFFEKNHPATFTHPFYSLMGDWVMFRDIIMGRMRF
ncbi:MAG: DUF962 domain-containing protein [Gammaproteobacteria bacterium]